MAYSLGLKHGNNVSTHVFLDCSLIVLYEVHSLTLSLRPFSSKVLTYLRSPSWDSRIAAGLAVEAIVRNIPQWDPKPKPKSGEL